MPFLTSLYSSSFYISVNLKIANNNRLTELNLPDLALVSEINITVNPMLQIRSLPKLNTTGIVNIEATSPAFPSQS